MRHASGPSWPAVAGLIVATALVSVTAVAAVGWLRELTRPKPALISNIDVVGHNTWGELTARFETRVLQRFPVGSPADRLRSELERDGFRPDWSYEPGEEHAAYTWGDLVCNYGARVWWRVDKTDRITELRGRYHEEGCL